MSESRCDVPKSGDFRYLPNGRWYNTVTHRFAKTRDVENIRQTENFQNKVELAKQEQFPPHRQDLWKQRIQSAQLRHEIMTGEKAPPHTFRYSAEKDAQLQALKEIPRNQWTMQMWDDWRDDMDYFYGEDWEDWADSETP